MKKCFLMTLLVGTLAFGTQLVHAEGVTGTQYEEQPAVENVTEQEISDIESQSDGCTETGISYVSVAGISVVDDGVVSDNLPQGIQFDSSTGTLTLNNFSYDCSTVGCISIEVGGYDEDSTVIINLQGTNTITNATDGMHCNVENTIIRGNGSLTLDGTFFTGISSQDFTMESGTVNIHSTGNNVSFYGINGQYGRQHYYDFNILGGELNITCGDSPDVWLIGIDTQCGNLTVKNAKINIDLGEAKKSFGLAVGWSYDEGEFYGGDLTIDNSTIDIDVKTGMSAYFYKLIDPSNNLNYYCGDLGLSYHFPYATTFEPYVDYMNNRVNCYYNKLKISSEDLGLGVPFADVEEDGWYYECAKYANDNGLMTGMGDTGNFAPAAELSRAQFACILHRMEGSPKVTYTGKFPDVKEGDFYTEAVLWANQNGILNGYSNGKFGPADNITREQMAVMISNYAKFKEYNTSDTNDLSGFPDKNAVSPFALDSVKWAVGTGLITGDKGNISPQGNASRAQCAAIMMRFVEHYK
ncbi:MAG: S-layer homology domain-containing protein [Lachnospiraceae bacterium]|nr:S-layer homology domain-containing protein [Lachnospiraceae bacterium]MDD3616661.1 S-layer homology domain-containing protein [Lachnospiraceae bacterium]